MAFIEIKKCRVGKVKKEGVTRKGERYKMFSVSEGIKGSDGNYNNQFFNCFASGENEKGIAEGLDVAIKGSLCPNNWEKDGVKHYDHQLFVKNIIIFGIGSAKPKDTPLPKEEPMELPFD